MKRDAIGTILDVGAYFDWFTPLVSMFGGGRGIAVPRDSQIAVDSALRACDIHQSNRQLLGDWYRFDVSAERYDDAIQALQQVGVK